MQNISRNEFVRNFKPNLRWGKLLETERMAVNVSRDELARVFGIEPVEIARWETGFGSPMGKLFYEIIVYLGEQAFRAASQLWTDIQIEKYFLLKNVSTCIPDHRRVNYCALGAVKDRHVRWAA